MINKRVENTTGIEWGLDNVGFHNASFSVEPVAFEQYMSKAGLPVYAVILTDKQVREINKELCGIRECTCGTSLDLIGVEDDGAYLVAINPDDIDEWDDLFEE